MPVPEMERLVAAPPAAMVAGLKEVMLGTGLLILNENVLELPPPGDGLAGFTTVSSSVPAVARLLPGTEARRNVGPS